MRSQLRRERPDSRTSRRCVPLSLSGHEFSRQGRPAGSGGVRDLCAESGPASTVTLHLLLPPSRFGAGRSGGREQSALSAAHLRLRPTPASARGPGACRRRGQGFEGAVWSSNPQDHLRSQLLLCSSNASKRLEFVSIASRCHQFAV